MFLAISTRSNIAGPIARGLAVLAALVALAGCTVRANPPAVPIFGSFFPAWIICAIGGIVLAVILRAILIAVRIDEHLPVPPLVYLCAAISGGIGLWFFWSGMI